MDIATIGGFLLICILLVVGMGFNVGPFIDVPSMAIVIGGTAGAIFMSYPMSYFFKGVYVIKKTILKKIVSLKKLKLTNII